jgi:hypothetical protein
MKKILQDLASSSLASAGAVRLFNHSLERPKFKWGWQDTERE